MRQGRWLMFLTWRSSLSAHNIFCPNCEGWSSTFFLDSERLFLEACRILRPFPGSDCQDACDFSHLLSFLQEGQYLLLFAVPQCSATLRLVECFKCKKTGSPLNTIQHLLRCCESPICLFVPGLHGELLCHHSAARSVTLCSCCPCQCFQAYSACLCFQLSRAQREGRDWT